jgi:hypothetical protein
MAESVREAQQTRHEVKEHQHLDLWAQTIQVGHAVQQASQAQQKAPEQQADGQREL